MHGNVDEHLTRMGGNATKTVVSTSEYTIGGNMSQSELEAFITSVSQYNARASLEAGVLKVRLGR